MPEIRHGTASWPGAIAVESCTYTLSHGISPGTAILRISPQPNLPALKGDLKISDGVNTITIPGCKLDTTIVEQDGDGRYLSIAIQDRRWQWRDFGTISGTYNQLDPHGKLIPWTIRSPRELAELCLKAMDEQGYVIDLPPGYTQADGVMHGQVNPPHIGLVPRAGVNPPIDWQQEVPAQALQRLAEMFGRHVVYCLKTDSVKVVIAGRGNQLPDGSIAQETPSLKVPATPAGVTVVGSPTHFQARFALEPVGEEWDGSYQPIDRLSYRPLPANGAVQINQAEAVADGTNLFQVFIGAAFNDPPSTGALFEVSTNNAATAVATLAAAINASADPRVRGVCRAEAASNLLAVTGVQEGRAFSFYARLSGSVTGDSSFDGFLFQAAANPTGGWELSKPYLFPGVRATDRLTLEQARALAQKSVYRCYRITTTAPIVGGRLIFAPGGQAGNRPLVVPGFGQIDRRQQIVLLPDQVEQVVPVALDRNLVDPNRVGLADGGGNALANVNFYNGYSRDKPAAMYGAISTDLARRAGFAFWVPNILENTTTNQQIFASFTIDPVEQVVTFSEAMYCTRNGRFYPIGNPVLQTACMVREADTNELRCAYMVKDFNNNPVALLNAVPDAPLMSNRLPDFPDFVVRKYPDVQLNLIGLYNADGSVAGARALERDAHIRAKYYLEGLLLQFLFEGALTRGYNGIEAIDCDGAISQVTWDIGAQGASTVASRNTEHSIYVPPYPARRRAEFLRPVNMEQLAPPRDIRQQLMTGPYTLGGGTQ